MLKKFKKTILNFEIIEIGNYFNIFFNKLQNNYIKNKITLFYIKDCFQTKYFIFLYKLTS